MTPALDAKSPNQPTQTRTQPQDFSAFGTRLDAVEEKELRWMWPGYLLSGKLNGLIGDADKGKSLVMLDIAARLTRGWPMPLTEDDALAQDERPVVQSPGNVVLLCAEDDAADTIRPRLRVAGADLAHVFMLEYYTDEGGKQRSISLADSTARRRLLEAIHQVDAKLLIIDPLAAFMGKSGDTDMNREQDMRAVLSEFRRDLAETDCAVWAIRHRGKDKNREPIHRALGSTAITAMFRSEWAVDEDPRDESQRVFNRVKNNLSVEMPSLTFHIADDGGAHPHPFIVWDGTSIWDARTLANNVETFSPRTYVKRLLADNPQGMRFSALKRLIVNDPDYAASKNENALKNLLHTMTRSGEVESPRRGEYRLPAHRAVGDVAA
jgi:AAA domain-containing protein